MAAARLRRQGTLQGVKATLDCRSYSLGPLTCANEAIPGVGTPSARVLTSLRQSTGSCNRRAQVLDGAPELKRDKPGACTLPCLQPVWELACFGASLVPCARRCGPPGFYDTLPLPPPAAAWYPPPAGRSFTSAMVLTSTPLETKAAAAAYNQSHTRLAIADTGGRLTFWQREGAGRSWALAGSLPLEGLRVTALCWAATQFGGLLAGGAADGSVAVWQEQPGEAGWRLAALLREGALGVQDLAFAPPELGPLLAVAYADGVVRCAAGAAGCAPGLSPASGMEAARPESRLVFNYAQESSCALPGLTHVLLSIPVACLASSPGSSKPQRCWQQPAGSCRTTSGWAAPPAPPPRSAGGRRRRACRRCCWWARRARGRRCGGTSGS